MGTGSGAAVTRRVMLGAALTLGCGAGKPRAAPPASAEPIALRRGVSTFPWFSLTREYPAPRTDYAWPPYQEGRPVPRRADLDALKAAGFDFIRIPVDPGPLLAFEGARRVALLDDVMDAVLEARTVDLKAVVSLVPNTATHHFTPAFMAASTAAPGFAATRGIVAEVAARLAGHDLEAVAFEPFNEPPQACGAEAWSAVQTSLLEAARAAAPGLTLVATGACGSSIDGLRGLDPAPILAFGRVMFTFHFYEPFLFSHQGAPWMEGEPIYRSLNGVPWPSSAGTLAGTLAAVRRRMALDGTTPDPEKREAYRETEHQLGIYFAARPDVDFVRRHLALAAAWGGQHGIAPGRILLGEFGALRTDSHYVAAGSADRARYIRDVRETAEAIGFPWAFWNLFDGMGLAQDGSHALDPAILTALGMGV